MKTAKYLDYCRLEQLRVILRFAIVILPKPMQIHPHCFLKKKSIFEVKIKAKSWGN